LTPTTVFSGGSLTLDFRGTVDGSFENAYTSGQPAHMSITCTQSGVGSTIACNGAIDTPTGVGQPAVPEPTSLAMLGSALFGFGVFRRRKAS
jgi:hypothetical protein